MQNMPAHGALDLIGRTPMLEVTGLDTGPCDLYLKLETQTRRSIKDRIALLHDRGGRDGREASPAARSSRRPPATPGWGWRWSAAKGYKLVLVVPDKMSREKVQHLRALGAEVRMTRSDVGKGHPEYYQDMARGDRREHARRVLRQPVQQPGQSAGPRNDHRAGDLGADGRRHRRGRGRRRLRRHADRASAATSQASSPKTRWCWPIRSARYWRR